MGLMMSFIKFIGCGFIFALYLIGVIFIPIDLNTTTKIINATGVLSFFVVIFSPWHNYRKSIVILTLGLLLLGAIDLIWYGIYKTGDVIYKNGYRGYLEAGKLLVFSSFTFLALSNIRFRVISRFHVPVIFLTQIIMFSRAFYQSLYLHSERIALSAMDGNSGEMGAATIAAYVVTFFGLYSAIVFIKLESKYKWFIFYASFALSFTAIMMTETRAAIVVYPAMVIAILFIEYGRQRQFVIKSLSGFLVLFLCCGLLFNKEIDRRFNELKSDVSLFTKSNDSMSSVGARFSMILAGFKSAPHGIEWQSLEQRAANILDLSKKDSRYEGAAQFLNVHMHNEIAEALSTKGIFGVVFLVIFYSSLIYYCIREKKYLLLVFPATIMLFGISDVITHDKPIPASWIVCLLLSVLFLSNQDRKNI